MLQCIVFVGSKILLAAGRDPDECDSNLSTELLYVFQRCNRITSIYSKLLSPFPTSTEYGECHAFAGSSDGRIVVCRWSSFFTFDTHEYRWIHVPSINRRCQMCDRKCSDRCFRCNRKGAVASFITSTMLLITGGIGPIANVCELLNCRAAIRDSSKMIYEIASLPNWIRCSTKLPLRIEDHTVIRLQDKMVMLIGGYSMGYQESKRTFLGIITEDRQDVNWTELAPMEHARAGHICFKMGEYVFVAGGVNGIKRLTCCEKYDVKNNKWEPIQFSLPYPIKHASALVNAEETSAFITGGLISGNAASGRKSVKWYPSNRVVIYENDKGFQIHKDTLRIKRERHISTLV